MVDRHDRGHAERLDDLEVAADVCHAGGDRIEGGLAIGPGGCGKPAMVRDRADGGDEHSGGRRQLSDAADDVEELLHPHVRAESAFGHDEVAELHRDEVGDQ